MRNRILHAVFAVLILSSSLLAQVAGRVTGTVIDSTGAAIPGATVGLQLAGGGTNVYTTTTTASGDFNISAVNAGTYDLVIEAKGFLTVKQPGVEVNTGRTFAVPAIKLEIASVRQTVEVSDVKESVETTNAEVSTTIVKSQIQNLPIVNRSPLGFLQTQVGINSGRGSTTVNGQRPTYVNVSLDGINIQDNFIRTNDVDFLPNLLLLDQVAEVTVVTSNASAASMGGSAQVQFVTPSGTNSFHGNAYWSNRNNYFAANTWFNDQSGIAKPFLNQNQLGGSLGGHIIKNKLFFYANYEAFRLKQQSPQNHTILSQDARNGIFTYTVAGAPQKVNILQAAGLSADSTIGKMLADVPSAGNNFNVGDSTSALLRNTTGYTFNKRNNRTRDNLTTKGDYIISPRNSLTVSYLYNRDILDRPDQDGTFDPVPNVQNNNPTKLLSMAWRSNPKPNLTNEVRFGFNLAPGLFIASETMPQYFLGGLSFTNPVNTFRSQGRYTNTYNFSDTMNWVHGRHTVTAGVQGQLTRIEQYNDAGITPTYTLGIGSGNTGLTAAQLPGVNSTDLSAANALLATLAGYVTSYSQTYNVSSRTSGFVNNFTNIRHDKFDNYAFYGQDNWKINRKLTLNLGLRWDYYTPVDERDALALLPVISNNNLLQTIFDPNTKLDFAGSAVGRPWYKSDKNNFAPNIGLAWDPSGEGKWAIRAGYSMSYVNDNIIRATDNSVGTNAGLQSVVTKSGLSGLIKSGVPAITTPTYKVPRTLADNYALSSTSALAMPSPDMVTPYVQQFSIGVQRSVKNFLIDARYVGNHATKAIRGFDYNQVNISQMMPDFLKAMNNGLLAQKAGGAFNPSYNASIAGSQQLPFFAALPSGGLLTNATVINDIQTGQVGELGSLYQTNGLNGPVNFFANPNVLGANVLTNYSNASYNSFQLDVTHRFSHGMQFQGNYVFSKVLSDAAGDQQTNFEPFLDINNAKIERARVAGSDLRHVFKANGQYTLPFGKNKRFAPSNRVVSKIVEGWDVAGIMTLQSGPPFSVLSGRGTLNRAARSAGETANTSLTGDQLNQLFTLIMTGTGPTYVNASVKGTDGRAVAGDGAAPFSGQIFSQPGPGTIGGLQRNYFTGPRVFNMDAKLSKMITLVEGKTLEFRADATNVFNHPTWFIGDQTITSTSFGKITSNYYGRRLVQFSLYFRF
jgi:hypothetical protein